MYRKLDDEMVNNLLESGISEFAENGFDKANIADIARRSGLSVGVIYKYFGDKDGFFLACVRHSLQLLDEVLSTAVSEDRDIYSNMEMVIRALVINAAEHKNYYVMYHEITAGGCRKFAKQLAEEIEQVSAKAYGTLIEDARRKGLVRQDIDAKMFAFFFDNLLMMLHFSLSCDYYIERMKIYCGKEPSEDELVNELMKFVKSALR